MEHFASSESQPVAEAKSRDNGSVPSVLDIFQEARDAIPEDDMEKLPVDGAAQVDHYVYGLPKR